MIIHFSNFDTYCGILYQISNLELISFYHMKKIRYAPHTRAIYILTLINKPELLTNRKALDLTSSIFNFISGIHTFMLYKHVATSLKVVRWVALMEYILFIVVQYVCKHILFLDNRSCPRMAEAKRKILIELFSKAVYTSYFFLQNILS